jgi:tRNA-Thr(GGU) m(6)t(6)A37 methyltransferase TsaA
MTVFEGAVAATLAAFGIDAVYTPAGGEPVVVRVIARRPDTIVGFGETRIHAETATFEVRANEVASPPWTVRCSSCRASRNVAIQIDSSECWTVDASRRGSYKRGPAGGWLPADEWLQIIGSCTMNGMNIDYSLRPVGFVHSQLVVKEDAPNQGSEGAPEAWVEIEPAFGEALDGIAAGQEVILLTWWLHQGRREVLQVHPRDDPDRPLTGVFATRAPDRPNPIGLHRVRLLEIAETTRLRVEPLKAADGTPVVDIKPVLQDPLDA